MSEPDDEGRLRAAVELAGENPSPGAQDVFDQHKAPVARVYLLIIVVAAVIGGLIGSQLGGSGSDGDIPGWRTGLGWALWAVGLLGCIVIVVQLVRLGQFRRGRFRWLRVLTIAQRRSLIRQVQGRDPVVADQLPLARRVADNLVHSTLGRWGILPVVAVLGGNALRSDSVSQWVIVAVIVVLGIVGGVLSHRQSLQANAFLAAHPETVGPTP